jgi:hypothetical protein
MTRVEGYFLARIQERDLTAVVKRCFQSGDIHGFDRWAHQNLL